MRLDTLPDSVLLQVLAYAGPGCANQLRQVGSRFADLIVGGGYARLALSESPDPDPERQLRRHVYTQPYGASPTPVELDPTLPEVRIPVGCVAFDGEGSTLLTYYVDGFYVVHCGDLYVVDGRGRMRGPFDVADGVVVLNVREDPGPTPYLAHADDATIAFTSPAHVFAAPAPHLPSPDFIVAVPSPSFGPAWYHGDQILFKERQRLSLHMYRMRASSSDRLDPVWIRVVPDPKFPNCSEPSFVGALIVIHNARWAQRHAEPIGLMLLRADTGDLVWSRHLPFCRWSSLADICLTPSAFVLALFQHHHKGDDTLLYCIDTRTGRYTRRPERTTGALNLLTPGELIVYDDCGRGTVPTYDVVLDHDRQRRVQVHGPKRTGSSHAYLLYRHGPCGRIHGYRAVSAQPDPCHDRGECDVVGRRLRSE